MSTSSASSGGIGFFGLLTVLFIGLKLTGVIDWSWWYVLAPLWIPWIVLFVVCIIAIIFYVIALIIKGLVEIKHEKNKKKKS